MIGSETMWSIDDLLKHNIAKAYGEDASS